MRLINTSILVSLCTILLVNTSFGQSVGINDDGSSPNAKAMLDIKSNTKGLLIPRMSTAERIAIAPTMSEQGLMVYDTTIDAFFYHTGAEWKEVSEALWMKDPIGINRPSNVGINVIANGRNNLSVERPVGVTGTDTSTIYAYRGGDNGNETGGGGSSFGGFGIDAAIKGVSDWGNQYSAGIAGYGYLDYNNSAALIGSDIGGTTYGILGFRDANGNLFSGYFDGNARFDDLVGIGIDPNASFALNVQSSTEDRTGYFYNSKPSTERTYGIYAGAFGTGSGDKRGGSFDAFGGTGENIGVRAIASGGTDNIAVYGSASGGATNWAGHFENGYVIVDERLGVGTTSPTSKLHVYNDAQSRTSFFANQYSSAGFTYALWATATNTGTGNALGIYTSAPGLGSYALYGVGDTYLSGDVRLGTTLNPTGYKLIVDGRIITEELRIQNSSAWPDYVFAEDYPLMDLHALEHSINQNKHLPGIPAASEIERDGILVGDMQTRMMEKIEELTLYIIQLNKRIENLEQENNMLKE